MLKYMEIREFHDFIAHMDCGTYSSRYIWSLPLIFVRDFPGNDFIKAPRIHPELARRSRANSGMIFQAYIKTFPGKSLTKMKGKDHIHLDK